MQSQFRYLPLHHDRTPTMQRCGLLAMLGNLMIWPLLVSAQAGELQFFHQRVVPILERHCYECHSHRASKIEGGLALDYRAGWQQGGDRGPAVVPGMPSESLLIQAIEGHDPDLKMPPTSDLSPDEIEVLKQWIKTGAEDDRIVAPVMNQETWWSLRPLELPSVPEQSRGVNPVDAFLLSSLKPCNLDDFRADRRTLLRRLCVDLLGYLPTLEEVRDFESDSRLDAYERMVERLLASPAYGERWARHWLDTIHFAESHGFEHDVPRPNAWTYRDYVIEQLNADIAWSEFIRQQLAADHFFPNQPELTPALGFLGAGTFDISSLTTAPMNFAYLDRDDMVTQTIGSFTGLTVQCARCHAHKFDPISQDDYYALQAVFAGVVKGDVPFDRSTEVAASRRAWQALLQAAKDSDATLLLDSKWTDHVRQWETSVAGSVTEWLVAGPRQVVNTPNANWTTLGDQSIVLQAPYPETSNTQVELEIDSQVKQLTAIRIEVLPDPSLPSQGPGAAANGNLHISEVKAELILPPGKDSAGKVVPLSIASAIADFDQSGWTAAHAIDNMVGTAWGIHPHEGKRHSLVLKLAGPIDLQPGSTLRMTLEQQHGRTHIIGRMRFALTGDANPLASELPDAVLAALRKPAVERDQMERTQLAAVALRQLATEQLSRLPQPDMVYAAAARVPAGNGTAALTREKPHNIQVLLRGDLDKPVREVGPGALSALTALAPRFELPHANDEAARRAALADWLADSRNCLTWRNIANRCWQFHFGLGLCSTPNDLGRMGSPVTQPALLDWLAFQMREHQSLKQLHRLIVCSQVYQLSPRDRSGRNLPEDVRGLLASLRGGAFQRLDADTYRDSVLRVAGNLNLQRGGPSVQQFTTSPGQQLTPQLNYQEFDWNSPAAGRRAIYRFVWRGIADPFMEALDFPDLGLLSPRRSESLSALQALTTYNHAFVLSNARTFASRLVAHAKQGGQAQREQITHLVEQVHQRSATESEIDACCQLADKFGLEAVARVLFNSNEFIYIE